MSFLMLQAVGDICLLNLNPEAAATVLTTAIDIVKDSPRAKELGISGAYMSLASAFFSRNEFLKAKEANDHAQAVDPHNFLAGLQGITIKAMTEKKDVLSMIEGLREFVESQIENPSLSCDQREGLRKALGKLSEVHTPEDLRKLSINSANGPSVSKGMERALKTNKRFAKDVVMHIQRAELFFNDSNLKRADGEIRAALRLNPRCVEAMVLKSNVLRLKDRHKEALKMLKSAEQVNKNFPLIQVYRAIVYFDLGDFEEALAYMEKAFNVGLGLEQVFHPWALIMLKLGRGVEVMNALKNAVNIRLDQTWIFEIKAEHYRQKNNYRTALREINRGISLESENFSLYKTRARIYFDKGEFDLCLQDVKHAIELVPKATVMERFLREDLEEYRLVIDPAGGEEGRVGGRRGGC